MGQNARQKDGGFSLDAGSEKNSDQTVAGDKKFESH
jgi:hypothetical protein